MISFRFNLDRAAQAIAYILARIGPTDKVKLTKLVYLADREHFLVHGYPITGDDQYAMKKGPVPSSTLDALDGDYPEVQEKLFRFIHIDDFRISLKLSPGTDALSAEECETLEEIVRRHGSKDKWAIVNETHELPEFEQTFVPGTSIRIPYERIAKVGGCEARYRKNRVVISPEAAERMDCPFPSGFGL